MGSHARKRHPRGRIAKGPGHSEAALLHQQSGSDGKV